MLKFKLNLYLKGMQMRNFVKIVLLIAIIGVGSVSGFSFAKQSKEKDIFIKIEGERYKYVIGSARKGGSYYKTANRLARRLSNALGAETEGSIQNMELLGQKMINVALVQGDAYALYCDSHIDECENYSVIKTDRTEVVQIIARKGFSQSDLQTDDYKDGRPAKISIGSESSGGAASWRNMTRLEENFAKAKVVIEDNIDSSSLIKLQDGEIDAVIKTSHYDKKDKFVRKVLKFKNLRFIDVDDWDLNDKIELNDKKEPLYDFKKYKIKYKGDLFGSKFKSIETKVFIVIDKSNMSSKQFSTLVDRIEAIGSGLWD